MASYAESLNALNNQLALAHQMDIAARRDALQRAMMARSLGDAEMMAREMNKASGYGLLSRLMGKGYKAEDMKTVAKPKGEMQALSEGGEGYIGEKEAASGEFSSLGKRLLEQARGGEESEFIQTMAQDPERRKEFEQVALKEGIGKGTGLLDEVRTGFGPKAQALLAQLDKITDTSAFDAFKQKAMDKAAANQKIKDWQDIPTEAEEQYQYHFEQYQKNPNNKTFAELVNQYRLLDNKFGWNMSAGLGAMKPPAGGGPGGGGRGGPKKGYFLNLITGERREKSPARGPNESYPEGWIKTNEAGEVALIKQYENTLKDPTAPEESKKEAQARLDLLKYGRVRRDSRIVTPLRGSTGFAYGLDYDELDQGLVSPSTARATASNDQYQVGKVYVDARGRKAKYLGNGRWGPVGG